MSYIVPMADQTSAKAAIIILRKKKLIENILRIVTMAAPKTIGNKQ